MYAITRATEKGGAQVGPSVAAVGLDGHEMEEYVINNIEFSESKVERRGQPERTAECQVAWLN